MKKILLYVSIPILLISFAHQSYSQCGTCSNCVSIQGQKLKYQGADFFPKALNFGVEVSYWQNGLYQGYHLGPNHSYFVNDNVNNPNTDANCVCGGTNDPSWCLNQIQAELNQISSMGFNAIRLVGLGAHGGPEPPGTDPDNFGTKLFLSASYYNPAQTGFCDEGAQDYELVLTNPSVMNQYFSWVENVLQMATNAQPNPLKVILLTGGGRVEGVRDAQYTAYGQKYQEFLNQLSCELAGNSALLAYDLYNEPSDGGQSAITGPKSTICSMVSGWYSTIKQNDPNHLVTIGLFGSGDVLSWDPGIIKVDFISFHIYSNLNGIYNNNTNYNNALQRSYSEFKWIEDNIRIPWIIGETGISARPEPDPEGNPSCDYESFANQQTQFHQTLLKTRDCGGQGYSWWDYHDVFYDNLCAGSGNFFGLIGRTLNSNKQLTFVTNEFTNFNPITIDFNNCPFPSNYYNPFNYITYNYSGTVKDQNNQVVKGAMIVGWDANWMNPRGTFSKPDGTFTLSSNVAMDKMFISAIDADIYRIWSGLPANIGTVTINYGGAGYNNPDKQINNVTVNNGGTYNLEAYNSITVNTMTINSGGNSVLRAGYNVKLVPGFKASYGSNFVGTLSTFNSSCTINARLVEPQVIHNGVPIPNHSGKSNPAFPAAPSNPLSDFGLKISPNPNQGNFTLNFTALTDDPVQVEIYDLYGKLVYSDYISVQQNQSYDLDVELKNKESMTYLIKITDFKLLNETKKVMVIK